MIKEIILILIMTFQGRVNDCGVASVLMVSKYYRLDTPYTNSAEWHAEITGGEDRALFSSELVYLLRDLGIEVEYYTYNINDVERALAGDYPMIFLDKRRAHFIVIWGGYVFDPKEGYKEYDIDSFLEEYEIGLGKGVGFLYENEDSLGPGLSDLFNKRIYRGIGH